MLFFGIAKIVIIYEFTKFNSLIYTKLAKKSPSLNPAIYMISDIELLIPARFPAFDDFRHLRVVGDVVLPHLFCCLGEFLYDIPKCVREEG